MQKLQELTTNTSEDSSNGRLKVWVPIVDLRFLDELHSRQQHSLLSRNQTATRMLQEIIKTHYDRLQFEDGSIPLRQGLSRRQR